MAYYIGTMPVGQELRHHGIKGMRWGQRRYQNRDGSLTPAGRVRYAIGTGRTNLRRGARTAKGKASSWYRKNEKKIKTAAKVAGTAAAVAGAAYLGKRYGKTAINAARKAASRAPFNARAIGYKANAARAKVVVGARSAASKARDTASRRARIRREVNSAFASTNRSSRFKNAVKGAKGVAGNYAKKVGGATGSAFRGAGYHARRGVAKVKNAARNARYMTGNIPGNAKRAGQYAAGKVAGKARQAASNVSYKAKRAASNASSTAKRQASFIKRHPRTAAVYGAGKAAMGGLYYAHARNRGASKGQAAATGAARAIGGVRAGQAVGLGTRAYSGTKKAVKRYNSPRAKANRKKYKATAPSRKVNNYEKKAKRARSMASMNRSAANSKSASKVGKRIGRINENYYTKRANRYQRKADNLRSR